MAVVPPSPLRGEGVCEADGRGVFALMPNYSEDPSPQHSPRRGEGAGLPSFSHLKTKWWRSGRRRNWCWAQCISRVEGESSHEFGREMLGDSVDCIWKQIQPPPAE